MPNAAPYDVASGIQFPYIRTFQNLYPNVNKT